MSDPKRSRLDDLLADDTDNLGTMGMPDKGIPLQQAAAPSMEEFVGAGVGANGQKEPSRLDSLLGNEAVGAPPAPLPAGPPGTDESGSPGGPSINDFVQGNPGQPGMMDSLKGGFMGAMRGVSRNWNDEAGAGLASMMPGSRSYQQELDKQRTTDDQAQQAAPGPYNTMRQLTSAPVDYLAGLAGPAASGAVGGLTEMGDSRASFGSPQLSKDMAVGAAKGAATGLAGQVVGGASKALGGAMQKYGPEMMDTVGRAAGGAIGHGAAGWPGAIVGQGVGSIAAKGMQGAPAAMGGQLQGFGNGVGNVARQLGGIANNMSDDGYSTAQRGQTQGNAMEAMATQLLQSNPQALGKYAEQFQEASQNGTMGALIDRIEQTDPEFRQNVSPLLKGGR